MCLGLNTLCPVQYPGMLKWKVYFPADQRWKTLDGDDELV